MAVGRLHEARKLLEDALRENDSDTTLREQLKNIYQVIISTNRRPRPTNSTVLSSQTSPPSSRDNVRTESDASINSDEGELCFLEKRQRLDNDSTIRVSVPTASNTVSKGKVTDVLLDTFSCIICCKLLFEPVTTPCGHTYCRGCLSRAIDFTDACPMCRTVLHLDDPYILPITNTLREAIQTVFPEEYENRRREIEVDSPTEEHIMSRLPLFPLNVVVFPMQKFPMHIFEARYRLMLRRIMQGCRKFGLVSLKRTNDGGSQLCDVGCVLEVTRANRLPDGRSFIDTVARERFRVCGHTEVDEYLVARTEVYNDEEDANINGLREIEERARTITESLIERSSELPFIQSALQRAESIPNAAQGPAALGLWLAGLLQIDNEERQRLLEMRDSAKRLREMLVILERLQESINSRTKRIECHLQ